MPRAHKMRNLEAKVPAEMWRELKGAAYAAYQAGSPTLARVAHLQLPISHRRVTRTTNLLERLFLEERRRTKIIPHAFGERAVLKLMYAALIRASDTWRRVVVTEFQLKQLTQLREHLERRHDERVAPIVKNASRSRIPSTQRT